MPPLDESTARHYSASPQQASSSADNPPANQKPPSVRGYFRQLFDENPLWLHRRNNDPIIARWLADHPGHLTMPRRVHVILDSLKHQLRKRFDGILTGDSSTRTRRNLFRELRAGVSKSILFAKSMGADMNDVVRLLDEVLACLDEKRNQFGC